METGQGQFQKELWRCDLTDDDVNYSKGKFDGMLGKLQEKTGKSKEALNREIDSI